MQQSPEKSDREIIQINSDSNSKMSIELQIEKQQQQEDKIIDIENFENLEESASESQNNTINNQKKHPYIGTLEEAPSYMSENPHLLTGYRINFNTYKLVFKSLFLWHNDTINVWTHLIGFILAFVMFIQEIYEDNPNQLTKVPLYFFYVGAIIMFLSSSTMHLLYCKSKKTCQCTVKLDYSGIAVCGIGKGMTFMCYALYCDSHLNWGYSSFWVSTWGILLLLSQTNWFHQVKFKKIKILLFALVSAGFIVPVFHILIQHWKGLLGEYNPMVPFYLVLAYFSVLALGVLIAFIWEFPEKNFPKTFDIIGSSHQIWHTLVIVDFIICYYSAKINFDLRSQNMSCGQE